MELCRVHRLAWSCAVFIETVVSLYCEASYVQLKLSYCVGDRKMNQGNMKFDPINCNFYLYTLHSFVWRHGSGEKLHTLHL